MMKLGEQFDMIVLGSTDVAPHTFNAAERAGLRTRMFFRGAQEAAFPVPRSDEVVWSVIPETSGGFRVDVIGSDGPYSLLTRAIAAEAMPVEILIPVPDWTPVAVSWRDEIPRLLGAQMHFLAQGDGEGSTTDSSGRTSVEGLYAIPRREDDARILGEQIAQDVAGQAGWPSIAANPFDEPAQPPWASMLSDLSDDLPVCRHEPQTIGDLKRAMDAGARDLNQLKQFTRMGMGVCQGRPCEELTAQLIAQYLNVPRSAVGRWTIRPPLEIVDLATLAGVFTYSDIPIPGPAPL